MGATLALLCIHADIVRRPSFLEITSILQGLAKAVVDEAADPGALTSRASSVDELLNPKRGFARGNNPPPNPAAHVCCMPRPKAAAMLVHSQFGSGAGGAAAMPQQQNLA